MRAPMQTLACATKARGKPIIYIYIYANESNGVSPNAHVQTHHHDHDQQQNEQQTSLRLAYHPIITGTITDSILNYAITTKTASTNN